MTYLNVMNANHYASLFPQLQENVKQNLPHTFAIIGKQRSLELQAR